MSFLRNITKGLRSLFRKEQFDRELDEELRAYQEMAAEEKMKDGLSRQEALRAVRLERGSLEVSREIVRQLGICCGHVVAGFSLRFPPTPQESRFDCSRRHRIGPGHWPEHDGIHVCECSAAPSAHRCQSTCATAGGLDTQSTGFRRAGLSPIELSRLRLLPRSQPVL